MPDSSDYVVLDTDVASLAFKRRLPPALLSHITTKPICITFVTFGELRQWATMRKWGTRNRDALAAWLNGIPVLPGGKAVGTKWGEISAHGRIRGRPRPQNDTWIAACCLAYQRPLATLNIKDFEDFAEYEGLRIIGHPSR